MTIKSKALKAVVAWAQRWCQSDGKRRIVLAKEGNKRWYTTNKRYTFFVDCAENRELTEQRKWLVVGTVLPCGAFQMNERQLGA